MNVEEIPPELKEMLDRLAGKVHSDQGKVMEALAEILTAHADIVMRTTTMKQWKDILRHMAKANIDKRLAEITTTVTYHVAAQLERAAAGRLAYAESGGGGQDLISEVLAAESETFLKAARIARGDKHIMLALLPSRMWTDEEDALVTRDPFTPGEGFINGRDEHAELSLPWDPIDSMDTAPNPPLRGHHIYLRDTRQVMVWTGRVWEERHKVDIRMEDLCSFCHG
jgi:hypothetical protein